MPPHAHPLLLDTSLLRPGLRLAVGVSGGADSVALLRILDQRRAELGIVLSAIHVHHGIRPEAESGADAAFVRDLCAELDIPFHLDRVNTPAAAREQGETLEEAARNLRYACFRRLLATGEADAVATAHTLDDQAETVLHRLLRGAWTEGLGAIHPVVTCEAGVILRPFLYTRRSEVEHYLRMLNQPWREDATNLDPAHTRNRLRHHLLPILAGYNPQIHSQLAQLATLARDEEAWWQTELARLLPGLLLPGRAVRGGGRAASTHPGEAAVALEIERLRPMAPALRRRVLRAAAGQLGLPLNFSQTERLLALCGLQSATGTATETPRGAKRLQLADVPQDAASTWRFSAERTPRELRLIRAAIGQGEQAQQDNAPDACELPVPGEVYAPALGLRLCARVEGGNSAAQPPAVLRAWRPGDRVHQRYSRGPHRVKELLERLRVPAAERVHWPVVEWQGRIVWMRGIEIDPGVTGGLSIRECPSDPRSGE